MNNISLKRAIGTIHQIVQQRAGIKQRSPFFFIVGAGISYPEIPLAGEIEKHCREVTIKYGYDGSPLPDLITPMEAYSTWFSRAYLSADQRQLFLRSIMEEGKPNRANRLLAEILLDGRVTRTVFTTNFDDLLVRALALFGERPVLCDHPQTADRVRMDSYEMQVIHVHGSYWYYDCCNLQEEIADRSGSSKMSKLLGDYLSSHSPLVVGYSGWEGDILMTSLKRRLAEGRLGTPLFWFCFRKEAVHGMPRWLTGHPDVYLVSSEEHRDASLSTRSPGEVELGTASTRQADQTQADMLRPPGQELPAEEIFLAMKGRFHLSKPLIMRDPLEFFYQQLERRFEMAVKTDSELRDDFNLSNVLERVRKARDAEREAGSHGTPAREAMTQKTGSQG